MINVSAFKLLNVVDSCALWNILSSELLYSAALRARCSFCCTGFVRYECLRRRRTYATPTDEEIKRRFLSALERSEIVAYELDIADLQEVAVLQNRKRLSMGELSSVAYALKTHQAFLTDDQKARKLGAIALAQDRVQTTPHLLGWLVYSRSLSDLEVETVLAQHSLMARPLREHLTRAYHEGLRCLLMTRAEFRQAE